jgi:SAM-dependent methyltransferase
VQSDWFSTPAGQNLLTQERVLAGGVLERVFGEHILQIGSWGPADQFLATVRTQSCALLSEQPFNAADAIAAAERLPVATDSVDALLLPHTLEMSREPHAVLREVDRVLRPDGRLIVIGFNPMSWWGLRNMLDSQGYPPGMLRHVSRHRLSDWLRLLDMRIDGVIGSYATAPRGRMTRFFHRWHWFASVYLLMATKESMPMTVVRPRLRQARPQLVNTLVNPTTRNVS